MGRHNTVVLVCYNLAVGVVVPSLDTKESQAYLYFLAFSPLSFAS